ncbi:cupin domain-containing protein [Ferrovibrio terrae]|uniref:Cupin domain-containing protein n=1 Tax=Ferrovibrio terrae TaxID=2594003 RepID=A0A516H6P4_9PROT|nr:cupin domain-containing protein [Ferrovibrio terrae]QDO99447.1 cupin domain-containing protein [Ferrovibrio terrae]
MSAFRLNAYDVPVVPATVQADFPGFSFDTYRDPPGQVWADFIHDIDEFVVVAEGQVEIEVAGERRLCMPGALVSIPAGVRHTLRTSKDAGSVWYYGYGKFGGRHGRA